jgi:predicted aspartyl protease
MRRFTALVVGTLALSAFFGGPVSADHRTDATITPFEDSPDGPIVKVRLSAKNPGVPDLELRFMLDTGAGVNVLDVSIPADYFWDDAESFSTTPTTVTDATQQQIQTSLVYLKRIEIAGITRDDQTAIRVDLKRTWPGIGEDEPIDGILGMSFLRGTLIVIDPTKSEIRWWQTFDGHRVPLGYDPSGSPTMTTQLSNTDVRFMLDTGSESGFQAPGQVDENGPSESAHFTGALGHVSEARVITAERIEASGKAWINVPVVVVKPGEGIPMVGREILFGGLLGLDFVHDAATFQLDANGNLPSLSPPTATPNAGLSLAWDRSGVEPRLTVGPIGPKSPMAVAGLAQGDVLVRVGSLQGKDLTIAAVTSLVDQGKPLSWVVRRNGKQLRFRFPVAAGLP